jgi:glycopeptide antibiotics resistance protein
VTINIAYPWLRSVLSPKTFWLYFTAILLLIVLPINNSDTINLNHIMILEIRGDYLAHALIFFPWAFFMLPMQQKAWSWSILGLFFSTGTELLQYLLPYRRFNINDLISNSLGILLGMIVLLLVMKRLKQQQNPDNGHIMKSKRD